MRLHPRSRIVEEAKIDMSRATTEVIGRHELTHAELQHILISIMAQWNKYAIRDERELGTANETGEAQERTPEGQSQ